MPTIGKMSITGDMLTTAKQVSLTTTAYVNTAHRQIPKYVVKSKAWQQQKQKIIFIHVREKISETIKSQTQKTKMIYIIVNFRPLCQCLLRDSSLLSPPKLFHCSCLGPPLNCRSGSLWARSRLHLYPHHPSSQV